MWRHAKNPAMSIYGHQQKAHSDSSAWECVNLILKKEAMWDFPYFSCMVTRLTSTDVSDELTLGIRVLACITLLFGLRE